MGQPVGVIERKGTRPGIVRFEANRSLTGMGHVRYTSPDSVTGATPAAELARRLFATGQVGAVHLFMNVVTVDLKEGHTAAGLSDIIESLYTYYRPGVLPPTDEELLASLAPEPAATGASPAAPAAEGGPAVDSRVPADLLERSRLARERWRAKQG